MQRLDKIAFKGAFQPKLFYIFFIWVLNKVLIEVIIISL